NVLAVRSRCGLDVRQVRAVAQAARRLPGPRRSSQLGGRSAVRVSAPGRRGRRPVLERAVARTPHGEARKCPQNKVIELAPNPPEPQAYPEFPPFRPVETTPAIHPCNCLYINHPMVLASLRSYTGSRCRVLDKIGGEQLC